MQVWGSPLPPIVVATDGRVDEHAPASIAYVAVDVVSGSRDSGWAWVPEAVKSYWGPEDGIALVEESAILLAVQELGDQWVGRDVIWFTDNSVVLAAMTKGASRSAAIDEAAVSLQLITARLGLRIWWEYIESKSNWADRLSRERDDPWLRSLQFSVRECVLHGWPWGQQSTDRWAWVRANGSALGPAMG